MTSKNKIPDQPEETHIEKDGSSDPLPKPDPELNFQMSSRQEKHSSREDNKSAQKSGQYKIIGPEIGKAGKDIIVVKGISIPPTKKTDQSVIQKSGHPAQKSGKNQIVWPKGGKTGVEVTAVEDKSLPPTPKPEQGYVLVDKTKHKDGK